VRSDFASAVGLGLGASCVGGLVQAVEASLGSGGQVRAVLEGAHQVIQDLGRALLLELQRDRGHGLDRLVDALGVRFREHDALALASLAGG